jgi:hypothetical protein
MQSVSKGSFRGLYVMGGNHYLTNLKIKTDLSPGVKLGEAEMKTN